ncbi:6-pyruvoyl tetrahydropterin synthase [Idiomarina sp. A28L]|uniref:6-carboxytetrahydropterin synthase n=1 Tax=Idiomarina sp. A28L TaxID=1036674 RepID=UPI0002138906|nr:6-carboxytetrahydropterin synthase [Idiomarina sp. A28L]EGN75771.1 6-pyruvoyl tetrahydropterin synthase [Idiomarina sp. A28L]
MQLFVNDLTVIDFSYLCPERGIVGESWIVDIILDGSLNDQSMVLDFGRVKKQVKAIIDQSVDHKLLIPAEHSFTQVTREEAGTHYWVDFLRPNKSIHLYCPADAYAFIDSDTITQETTIAYLQAVIKRELPANVKGLELTLRAEEMNGFYYHYTHGLKKHDGNCQRIAHGHRSAIKIFVDGMRSPAWEQRWSRRWEDIYVGTEEDISEISSMRLSSAALKHVGDHHIGYSYMAEQGLFELILPAQENEVMVTDTTVECIADYVAHEVAETIVAESTPRHRPKVKVIAFEGVGKGAIGYA